MTRFLVVIEKTVLVFPMPRAKRASGLADQFPWLSRHENVANRRAQCPTGHS